MARLREGVAPLDDPAYEPEHPPVNGEIPDVVVRWGPPSQLRWFRRFGPQLGLRKDWDRYWCASRHHLGACCWSCEDEAGCGVGVQLDGWCCCRDARMRESWRG